MRLTFAEQEKVKLRFLHGGDEPKRGRKYVPREFYEPPEDFPPVEFCMDTSLHGLHHIGEPRWHLFERLFWIIAFMGAVATAGYLIHAIWSGYFKSPIMTVFGATQITLDRIPFPAVTICNVNKVRQKKWAEYESRISLAEQTNNQTELYTLLAALEDMQNVCSTKTFAKRLAEKKKLKLEQQLQDPTAIKEMEKLQQEYKPYSNHRKTLIDVAQRCDGMIQFCMWLDEIIPNCTDILFEEVETEFGFCCAFNNMPLSLLLKSRDHKHYDRDDSKSEEERDTGWKEADVSLGNLLFTEDTKDRKYPLRQKYPGRGSGLSMLLNPDLEQYSCTNTDSEGFSVRISGSLDYPQVREKGILIGTGSEVFINARPEITLSEPAIRKFDLDKRRCVFDDEKSLQTYNKYTLSNCQKECSANLTLEKCGCIRYYQSQNYNESLVCPTDKYQCTRDVRKNISTMGMSVMCQHCLPSCIDIKYSAEVTSMSTKEYNMNRIFDAYYGINSTRPANVSILHVYMGMDFTYPRVRKEVYKVIELISNTGALLGLCLGFSMLSLLEVLYYFSIRLCFRCRKKKMEKSASPPVHQNLIQNQTQFTKSYKIGNLIW